MNWAAGIIGAVLGGAAVFAAAGLGTQWALARHERRRREAAARRTATAERYRAAPPSRPGPLRPPPAAESPGPPPRPQSPPGDPQVVILAEICGCVRYLTRAGVDRCGPHKARYDLAWWEQSMRQEMDR